MLLANRAKEEFNVKPITSPEVEWLIEYCAKVYGGKPEWEDPENHIKTINFARSICTETARLATLGIGIHVDGSTRAEWLQKQIDAMYYSLRQWVEYGCAYGTVVLKPNGDVIKLYTPGQFEITHQTGGVIDGMVFHNQASEGDRCFDRLEYHRFEGDAYVISNKCFTGTTPNSCKDPIAIEDTPWANLQEEARIVNVEQPLFAVLKTPNANNIDVDSPVGLPVFADALEELRDLDVAYSRNAKEIEDSKRTVLLDTDALLTTGAPVAKTPMAYNHRRDTMGLPDMVKNIRGDGKDIFYQEINPNLNTDTRLKGINALLSQIGYKVGFSNGYFVFNEQSGIQTATGVEAEQQRTIQYVKDVRDQLEKCISDLLYALTKVADLYALAPVGTYEAVFDFGDITYNREEDRSRWWGYVQAGKVPAWMFFVKFEGMTEEDAKAMTAEAQPKEATLFS